MEIPHAIHVEFYSSLKYYLSFLLVDYERRRTEESVHTTHQNLKKCKTIRSVDFSKINIMIDGMVHGTCKIC